MHVIKDDLLNHRLRFVQKSPGFALGIQRFAELDVLNLAN
jgi:hypothetical protein